MMFLYLLKVSACTAIFFAGYQLLLSRLTFFKLNRTYLLFCLMLSFIIPALSVSHETVVLVHQKQVSPVIQYSADNTFGEAFTEASGQSLSINWMEVALYIYVLMVIGLFARTVFSMLSINKVLSRYTSEAKGNIVFVQPDSKIKNCSFLTKIIIDASLPAAEQDLVIKHESVHVIQWHALDKLIVNLAVCMLWFNPFIYLWRNAIDHNHEFLADEATAKAADKKHYASLLLNLAMPANQISIHHFSKLPLKNRIAMMYQKPNSNIRKITYLALFPLIALCCVAFINRKDVEIQMAVFDEPAKLAQETVKSEESKDLKGQGVSQVLQPPNIKTVEVEMVETPPVLQANVLPNRSFDNGLEMNMQAENVLDAKLRSIQLGRELVLVIDAGHGGQDGATVGLNGEKEKDLNLRAATILKEEADKRKIKVILTRSKDKFIALRDRLPGEDATAFISIHHNSMPANSNAVPYSGIEAFVAKRNSNLSNSEKFAARVLSSLGKLDGLDVRQQLKSADLLLLRESKVPAMVLELGNVMSAQSMDYVKEDENLRRICNLILDGFIDFSGC